MKSLPRFWPLFILLILVWLFYFQVFLYGKIPVPTDALAGLYHPWRDVYQSTNPRGVPFKNFLITDPFRQIIPWRKLAINQWKSGIPGWNPYSFSGTPLTANTQAGIYYPLNILFFIFEFLTAWNILIISQQLIAVFGMYLYLKNKSFSVFESLFGSVAWGFCGFMTVWLTWGTMGQIAALLPFCLLFCDKLITGHSLNIKSIPWMIMFLLSLIFAGTGGHIQISAYVISFVFIYGCSKLLAASVIPKYKIIIMAALFCASFLVLFFINQPLIGYLQETVRATSENNWKNPGWFIPWQNLLQFIVPDFFGNPATLNYWGVWNYAEFSGYIGIIPLFFAVSAVFFTPVKKYIYWKLFLAGLFLMVLPGFLSGLPFYLKLPVISALQPTRLMVLIDFVLIVLSVYGMRDFNRNKSVIRVNSLFLVIFILLGGTVFFGIKSAFFTVSQDQWSVSRNNLVLPVLIFCLFVIFQIIRKITSDKYPRLFQTAIILLLVADLFRFGWKFNPFTDSKYFFPRTEITDYLTAQKKPFRIISTDDRIFPPETNIYYGIESVGGYDPLYTGRYAEFIAAMERGQPDITGPWGFNRIITPKNINSPVFNLLNIRYVLSFDHLDPVRFKFILKEGDTYLYENNNFQNRVFFAGKYSLITEKRKIIERFYTADFDPKREIILESDPEITLSEPGMEETVTIRKYGDNDIILDTFSKTKRLVYLGNIFSPGWKMSIDGVSGKLYRANYLFTAFAVPAGEHTVRLRYN